MSWVAVAVGVGGAVVGAVGANKQAKAAKSAAQMGADAAGLANEIDLQMYNQSRQDAEPWRQAGNWGLQQYMMLLGAPQSAINNLQGTAAQSQYIDPNDHSRSGLAAQQYLRDNPDVAAAGVDPWTHYINGGGHIEGRTWGAAKPTQQAAPPANSGPAMSQADLTTLLRNQPGQQFAFAEGQRALESGAAASGGLFSGKAGKALVQYGQNMGDQNYTNVLNRYAALAGVGQTQNAQNAAYGQAYANNAGNNLMTSANARASGLVGANNAWANWGQQAANAAGQIAGAYLKRG